MGIQNRQATCDICGRTDEEKQFGAGWENWVMVHGIGAEQLDKDKPIENKHMEFYVCPKHVQALGDFLTMLQGDHK